MKKDAIFVITGTIMIILGIIFHLQGQSVIGPESSFMYSNPSWVTYGIQITIVGVIIIIAVAVIKIIKKSNYSRK